MDDLFLDSMINLFAFQNYVASARHHSSSSTRQAGAVLDLANSRQVEGSARYEWFGSSLAFLKDGILAVGSPTWTDGSVRSEIAGD